MTDAETILDLLKLLNEDLNNIRQVSKASNEVQTMENTSQ